MSLTVDGTVAGTPDADGDERRLVMIGRGPWDLRMANPPAERQNARAGFDCVRDIGCPRDGAKQTGACLFLPCPEVAYPAFRGPVPGPRPYLFRLRLLGRAFLGLIAFRGREQTFGQDAGVAPDRALDLVGDLRIVLEEFARVLAALANPLRAIGEP
jgi:hypothetical protein